MTRQTISVELSADVVLEIGDLWPDGEAPDVVTAEVVRDLLLSGGRKDRVLRDWCLLDELRVVAVVDTWPEKGQRTTEAVEVWR